MGREDQKHQASSLFYRTLRVQDCGTFYYKWSGLPWRLVFSLLSIATWCFQTGSRLQWRNTDRAVEGRETERKKHNGPHCAGSSDARNHFLWLVSLLAATHSATDTQCFRIHMLFFHCHVAFIPPTSPLVALRHVSLSCGSFLLL